MYVFLVPGSFSVKPSQESPLVSQQRTAPRPPTQARGMATSLTKIQIPSIHVSSSESRSNTPPMSLASSPTSIYARDFFSQQIDLPVPRPRSYTAPNKILLHPASQRNSPSISRTSELGGHVSYSYQEILVLFIIPIFNTRTIRLIYVMTVTMTRTFSALVVEYLVIAALTVV